MDFKKFSHYTTEDFVLDTDFKQAVIDNSPNNTFLKELIAQFPSKEGEIREAAQIVRNLDIYYDQQTLSARSRADLFKRIQDKHQSKQIKIQKIAKRSRLQWQLGMAASFLLIISLGWFLFQNLQSGELHYQTQFGERLEIQLPDGSEVVLNANSHLIVPRDWDEEEGETREVTLIGEAFFKVEKKPATNAKFVVHTNGPDIEVLGTRFNVDTRKERTNVLLEEGKIRLKFDETIAERSEILMKEGELVEYSDQGVRVQKTKNPENLSSWKNGFLSLDHLSFKEILIKLEAIYGVRFDVKNQELYLKNIDGVLPTENLNEALETLETLFLIHISKKDDLVIIQ